MDNQTEAERREARGRLTFNLAKNERQYFTIKHDKRTGAYTLELRGNVNKALNKPHTKAFEHLVQTIRQQDTVRVSISETYQTNNGPVLRTGANAGGGVTIYPQGSRSGDTEVYLARGGSPFPTFGVRGQVISDPVSIIAAHEVLGHARLHMLGLPSGQRQAIDVENEVRRGRGLEERDPNRP